MDAWPDRDEMLGEWKEAFTGTIPNPNGALEPEADFSKPRIIGQATKQEGGRVRPRMALLVSLATLAGLVSSAVPAAGGELKPWSGGATPPLALRDLQGKEHKLAAIAGLAAVGR